jgi:hypothetical protein
MLKSTFLSFLNILGFNTKIIEAFEKKYVILGQFPLDIIICEGPLLSRQ